MAAVVPSFAQRFPLSFFTSSRTVTRFPRISNFRNINVHSLAANGFSWDDVFSVSKIDDSLHLQGYLEKVKICNRGSEKKSEFVPFLVGSQIVGYVHKGFLDHLKKFQDVFTFPKDDHQRNFAGDFIALHPSLDRPDVRTEAVGDVIKELGKEVIPGIRNELYPVTSSFGMPIFFSLERAAAPYFGIKPHGISCKKNLLKECEEEAGIPPSISDTAVSVGAVSYADIDGHRYKRDVLFCYDLELPDGFIPSNQDGEVESFKLIPIAKVANIIQRTEFFKPNCCLVIIDFLVRHGYINPDDYGYLQLLQCLRDGDCS
ncbi:nudix hydrolase 20, chloroplastic-like isoform X2 [Aristolochia californica]|uniref:nudix hydrolase 20, chloroplastic-like isoform X2 n=1 Tax=Aristolochia californica TaxID=171875 RepID=UPI0035E15BF3